MEPAGRVQSTNKWWESPAGGPTNIQLLILGDFPSPAHRETGQKSSDARSCTISLRQWPDPSRIRPRKQGNSQPRSPQRSTNQGGSLPRKTDSLTAPFSRLSPLIPISPEGQAKSWRKSRTIVYRAGRACCCGLSRSSNR